MTALTSLARGFGLRIALGGALLASACQHDSDATFDDAGLTSPDTGGSSADAGAPSGGTSVSGGSSAGGTKAGSGNTAGKTSSAGVGGTADGGKAGSSDGGTDPSGGAGVAGTAQGGTGGKTTGGGGSGGTNPKPEPITVNIVDTADTYVASCYPNTNFGEASSVNVDHDQCTYQGLLNPSLADIPDGAIVSEATFTLTCINVGNVINVSYVGGTWSELLVDWYSKPENGTALGTVHCQELGKVTIDLTAAVKAWLSGAHEDNGIYLRTDGTDGTDFASSEATDEAERPTLSVTYTLPLK